ncbi:pyrimidine 5'-nucleotidase [Janthinobacterium agaricidamnosum]
MVTLKTSVPNSTRSDPVWLFDLDNTLHNASHAIFPAITANMNTYIARVLGDGATPAGADIVNAVRSEYWRRYGATLLGMMRHHQVEPADFLHQTHLLGDLKGMVRAERGLGQLLKRLPGRKILLTNAPRRYSRDVLRHLRLQRHFSHHIAIEAMQVHRQLRPKPSRLMLRKLMRKQGLRPGRCILVEDTLANLKTAKELGLHTAWVTQYLEMADPIGAAALPKALNRPAYVDVKVKSVRHLVRRLHCLRQASFFSN